MILCILNALSQKPFVVVFLDDPTEILMFYARVPAMWLMQTVF